jgi:lipopolysaccharide transport system permease protein
MIALYTLVFANLMQSKFGVSTSKYSYCLYLCSGLLAWNLFTELANRGCLTLSENKDFIKKLSFKPYILFFASSLACLFNFFIGFVLYSVVLLVIDPPSVSEYAVFLALVFLLAVLGTCFAIVLGCMNVFLKDVYYATQILFQLLFWATPIVYLQSSLPEFAKNMVYFNPVFSFLESMHQVLFFHRMPDPYLLGLCLFWVSLGVFGSSFVYTRSISLLRDHL